MIYTTPLHFSKNDIHKGALACWPVFPSVFIFGAVLGVLANTRGFSLGELVFMSITVFAGSSQFVAIDLWRESIPAMTILVSTAMINMRYVLIGSSLRPIFQTRPLWAKICGMHFVADENWAITMTRDKIETPGFLLGGGLALGLVWVAGNITGYLLGGGIPDPSIFGFDFAFTAVFCALTVSLWKDRKDLLPWAVAAFAAAACHYLLDGSWSILIGAATGAMTSAFTYKPSPSAHSRT